jgi:hypothetical protein
VSRDGIGFDRSDRRPYVGRGLPGEPDSANVYMGIGFVRRGHEIYQYYGGGAGDHGSGKPAASAIMRVAQRLDGFVSANADATGGEIVTPLLAVAGRALRLNIDTAAMGTARVELRDPEGVPIPGFELRNCTPVIANDTACEVRWRGGPDLGAHAAKPLSLRITLHNARLFALQFV